MAYNAKDIICISFRVNDLQLFSISLEYGLDFGILYGMKDVTDYLWVETKTGRVLFYGNKDIILVQGNGVKGYTSKELKMLRKMEPVKPKKIKKDLLTCAKYLRFVNDFPTIRLESLDRFIENNIVVENDTFYMKNNFQNKIQSETQTLDTLDLDSVLDKINESGINSLTKEEKEFLDKLAE